MCVCVCVRERERELQLYLSLPHDISPKVGLDGSGRLVSESNVLQESTTEDI